METVWEDSNGLTEEGEELEKKRSPALLKSQLHLSEGSS